MLRSLDPAATEQGPSFTLYDLLIYAAKHANMDCGAIIDLGLLSMRRTLAELRAALDPVQDAPLLRDLESLFSYEDELEDLESNLRGYFSLD